MIKLTNKVHLQCAKLRGEFMKIRTKLIRALVLTLALAVCLGMLFTSCGEEETTDSTTPATTAPTTGSTASSGTTDSSEATTGSSDTTDSSDTTGSSDTTESSGTTESSDTTDSSDEGTTDSSDEGTGDEPCTEHKGGTATCTKKAECEACGEEYGEFAAHTEVAIEAVAPTCTVAGSTAGVKCSVCDTVITATEVVPATGHTYGAWETVTEATCTEAGEKKRTCACGDVATEAIPATGHTEQAVEGFAPTCTEAGLTDGARCEICDEVLVERKAIPAMGHKGGTATCTEKAKCESCGVEYGETLPHEWKNSNDCTKPRVCSECGAEDETITSSHEWLPATCTEKQRCSKCSATLGNPKGHKWEEKCEEKKTCTVCGETEGDVIPHAWVDANCLVAKTCSKCSATDGAPLDHEFVAGEVVAPTCEAGGYTVYTCVNGCNKTENRDEKPALGHEEIETVTKPTCITTGFTTVTCSRCDLNKKTDETNPIDHVFDVKVEVVNPTCTEGGYTVYGCSSGACGRTENRDETAARGHSYEDGVCTGCGEEIGSIELVASKKNTVNVDAYTTVYVVFTAGAEDGGKFNFTFRKDNASVRIFREGVEEEIPLNYSGVTVNGGESVTFIIVSSSDSASVVEVTTSKVEIGELPEEEI